MTHLKKFMVGVSALMAVILIFIVTMYALGVVSSEYNEYRLSKTLFDGKEWQQHAGSSECVRGEMIADMESNYLKNIVNYEQLMKLLGKVDREYKDRKGRWMLEYEFGDCLLFGNSAGGYLTFEIDNVTSEVIDITIFQD